MALFKLLVVVVALAAGAALALTPPPFFELNMDLPPEQRWAGALDAVLAAHPWEYSFGKVLDLYIPQLLFLPSGTLPALEQNIKTNFPTQYAELQGLSAAFLSHGQNLTVQLLSGFVYSYELSHISIFKSTLRPFFSRSCTGILSLPQDPALPIIHGRNMDESPHAGRNLTLRINVTRGGQTLYQIFDWTWVTTGHMTSARIGGVTMEENWRNYGMVDYEQLMARIMEPGTLPAVFMQREVQMQQMTFGAAVKYVMAAKLAAPEYTIMSGTQRRGAIFTLYFNASHNVVDFLNDASNVTFMVQTNYDRWLQDPWWDPRRTAAHDTLKSMGRYRSGTDLGVWMALSTWPVHNPTTMYSVLLSTARVVEGYVREALKPDGWNPWDYGSYQN